MIGKVSNEEKNLIGMNYNCRITLQYMVEVICECNNKKHWQQQRKT